MEHLNYVRRCKKKTGHERHETLHAADNNSTFCGKEINGMWFIESNAGLEPDDVTCKECRRLMRSNAAYPTHPTDKPAPIAGDGAQASCVE